MTEQDLKFKIYASNNRCPKSLFRDLLHRLVAVSFATSDKDLVMANVAGFVCVTDINVKEEKITILAPQLTPISQYLLLVSEVQFVDSQY